MAGIARIAARARRLYAEGGMRALIAKLRQPFDRHNRAFRRRLREDGRRFDADGYDTRGIQRVLRMDTIGPHVSSAINHAAAPPADFGAAIAALDIPIEGTHFVDLGSGKGRALLLAADLPFASITGVEFARELHEIADANLARRSARRGVDARLRLVHADAASFDPPNGPLIAFLYHPFGSPVIDEVAARLLASWRAHPRPMRVLYLNPVHLDAWTRLGWRTVRREQSFTLLAPPIESR